MAGFTSSTSEGAAGVQGGAFQTTTTGSTYGVEGFTSSTHEGSAGVVGNAFNDGNGPGVGAGEVIGVEGNTNSISDFAAGVAGNANGATGWTFGVIGQTNSSHELAAGVAGVNDGEGTPTGSGVLGVTFTETTTAGTFANMSGTGKVISGRSGNEGGFTEEGVPIGPFPEVFRVEGDGDVVANVGDFQTLGAGKGLILKSPNGTVCRRLGIDDSGALLITVVSPCP